MVCRAVTITFGTLVSGFAGQLLVLLVTSASLAAQLSWVPFLELDAESAKHWSGFNNQAAVTLGCTCLAILLGMLSTLTEGGEQETSAAVPITIGMFLCVIVPIGLAIVGSTVELPGQCGQEHDRFRHHRRTDFQ